MQDNDNPNGDPNKTRFKPGADDSEKTRFKGSDEASVPPKPPGAGSDKTRFQPPAGDKTRFQPPAGDKTVFQNPSLRQPRRPPAQNPDSLKAEPPRKAPAAPPSRAADKTQISRPSQNRANRPAESPPGQKPAAGKNSKSSHQKRPVGSPAGRQASPKAPNPQAAPGQKEKARIPESAGDSTVFSSTQARATGTAAKTLQNPDLAKLHEQKVRSGGVEVPESKAGRLKNRFILEKVLGAGGMGVVYKAKDLLKVEAKDRDPYVAIKVLGEEFKSHPHAFIALQRESRKTQRIAHPNIVNVHDFDKDGDVVFMTMEFLEGTPLDKLLKKYRNTGLAEADAMQILEGICAALAYAHDQSIIHSDLKPGNIFVTKNSVAKVFDFGIARAVASAERQDMPNPEDKTVFDAGNLGALTPAYASYEMLEGETPDIRDDIYALGCIAYELFAGDHPFKRKNAKEAKKQGLKPERIDSLTKQQWRVIEKSLSFDREGRVPTVGEFWESFSKTHKTPYAIWAVGLLVVALAGVVVWQQTQKNQIIELPQFSEDDVRSKVELELRLETAQKNLRDLFDNPVFDERWESALWAEIQTLGELLQQDSPQYVETLAEAFGLYKNQIDEEVEKQQFALAKLHIDNSKRYSNDANEISELDSLLTQIEQMIADLEKQRALEEEQARLARTQKEQERKEKIAIETRRKQFDVALNNVNQQLECTRSLDMDDFSIAIKKLRDLNMSGYKKVESNIVQGLSNCIQTIAQTFPDRARTTRDAALELFKESKELRNILFKEIDPCSIALAGLGARGARSSCQDELSDGSKGPRMVVIPAKGSISAFAIGRYEVSIEEFHTFCKSSSDCKPTEQANVTLPVTNIPASLIQKYLRWISKETGKQYRLPSTDEWQYAATARNKGLDNNRNCFLDSRGIMLGGSLVASTIGQQNAWGVVNYVGNAMELVSDRGGKYLALGGSYSTQMDSCTLSTQTSVTGAPDPELGFRVVRELSKD